MTHLMHPDPSGIDTRRQLRNFLRHYLEMVLAMVVGMAVLGPITSLTLGALGWSAALHRPDVAVILMSTHMTVAMTVWMRFRGHAWPPVAEMAAAMYLPFVVLLVPLWQGAISEATLMVVGHVLMLPAMAGVMLLRRDEYTQAHHGQCRPVRGDATRDDDLVTAQSRRVRGMH